MKIAICQINPRVGDIKNNVAIMLDRCKLAAEQGMSLMIFPELALTGYPPKDLLLRQDFLEQCHNYLEYFAKSAPLPTLLGAPILNKPFRPYNCGVLLKDGVYTVAGRKRLLPNYNVFDEQRYFSAPFDNACNYFTLDGKTFLLSICEDAWNAVSISGQPKYHYDPIDLAVSQHGAPDFIINISASPFSMTKGQAREKIFSHIASKYRTPVLVCGQVGANDQLLFDGHSMIISPEGRISRRAKLCQDDMLVFDSHQNLSQLPTPPKIDKWQKLISVLVMGIKDYVEKCGASGIILGLSGGLDSALCLTLACMALGKDRVHALYLPSKYSSEHSRRDAQELADNLGIPLSTIAIEETVDVFRSTLAKEITGASARNLDLFDQNLQSRTRCLMIMALANAKGYLMLATSNKSELALGYTTIYGDMCGALSPIGDVYKTWAYSLANALNYKQVIIPQSIIDKEPSAELKPDQKDSDSMPEYKIIDEILYRFIEEEKGVAQIANETNLTSSLIKRIIKMSHLAEFKRRQAPFSLMVNNKVFGDARRMPIAKKLEY